MSPNHTTPKANLRRVAGQFRILGAFRDAAAYGSGHINDTYAAVYDQAGTAVRYILQRINHNVFRNPVALMDNVRRVTEHLAAKCTDLPDSTRRVLTLVPTKTGASFLQDDQGSYWRCYLFIEQARTYDAVESERQAFQAARAFAQFQQMLADLPAPRLHDTVPDFHHTPRRFEALERVIASDSEQRVRLAKSEIDFALRRRDICGVLIDAGLPERVTHNDTKFNNVMLDDATGEGICVIDLDTVMPGLALYDFGDMVRTATSPAKEDERDLSQVHMQFPMFEALLRGYLSAAGGFLTDEEKRLLPVAGKLITFEVGIRFLADFLAGDPYFKVHREGHNLDRCRTQFRLVESIEAQEKEMNDLLKRTV
jgi:hypothetical protein